jgi:hypothetical protein
MRRAAVRSSSLVGAFHFSLSKEWQLYHSVGLGPLLPVLKTSAYGCKAQVCEGKEAHIELPLPIRFVPSKKNFGWTDSSTKSADTSISSSNPGANGGATASLRVPIDNAVHGSLQRHALLAVATAVSGGGSGRGIVGRGFVTLLRMEDAVKLNQSATILQQAARRYREVSSVALSNLNA